MVKTKNRETAGGVFRGERMKGEGEPPPLRASGDEGDFIFGVCFFEREALKSSEVVKAHGSIPSRTQGGWIHWLSKPGMSSALRYPLARVLPSGHNRSPSVM
jgi:hypothetical protein